MVPKESTTRSATARDGAAFLPRRSPMFSYLLVLTTVWCQGQSCDISSGPIPGAPGTVVDNNLKPQADGDEQVLGYTPPGPLSTQAARPSNLIAEAAADGSVLLTWADNSFDEEGFIVRRYDSTAVWTDYATVAPDTTTYVDAGVEARKTYCYQIVAFNASGTGASPQRCVRAAGAASTPDSALPDETAVVAAEPPLSPSGLAVAPSGAGELTLTWADNAVDEAGFVVRRYNGRAGWEEIGRMPADAASFVDATVSPGQSYCYQVAAFTETLQSRYSTTACAKAEATPQAADTGEEPTDNTPSIPGSPQPYVTSLVVEGEQSVVVRWGDPLLQPIGFTVELFSESGRWVGLASLKADAREYRHTSVSAGKAYCYRVRADAAEQYEYTEPACAVIPTPLRRLGATQTSILATNENQLRDAARLAKTDVLILIDREIRMTDGLSFNSRDHIIEIRGTTTAAGIRFTKRWDGNWNDPNLEAQNGLEFNTRQAVLRDLRICGYEWHGSAVKSHVSESILVVNCVFEDNNTIAYPPQSLPVTNSTQVWYGNSIGGSAPSVVVTGCRFLRCSLSDSYGHATYLKGNDVVIANNDFIECNSQFRNTSDPPAGMRYTIVGNRIIDPQPPGRPHAGSPFLVYCPQQSMLFAFNQVRGSLARFYAGSPNAATHVIDYNDYAGSSFSLQWATDFMTVASWTTLGFDRNSILR